MADVGYDPNYGARPLKRTIQRELETVVARGIIAGEYDNGDTIAVDVINDRLQVSSVVDVQSTREGGILGGVA